ncbi:hypothetical protein [Dactylosporangium sp. CA-092794]|uniref:hypothetical protein n=1 Tax=Dactylosporangium sp. CA-092794 TaxID=3239929 RepID=UPI003D93D793
MTTLAVLVPLVWLAWLILTEWVPMFPLNDLSVTNLRHRALAATINYPFPLLIAVLIGLRRPWSAWLALGLCALVLAGHLYSWWLPYLGVKLPSVQAGYERDYARTWKILPAAGHAVVIDVQHMVVGGLTLAMAATTLLATMSV